MLHLDQTSVFCLCAQIAELVATEFFEQGDKERRELNIEPSVSVLSLCCCRLESCPTGLLVSSFPLLS